MFFPDFEDLLRLFNKNGVKYLLVGGYAFGMYAEPRATKDLDLWIGMDIENAEKEPQRVDILADINGCDFEDCYTRRVRTSRQGITISVISLEDLIVNKRKAGRAHDLVDVKKLEIFLKKKKKKK